MAKLQGHIERITFSSEENGFSVCKLKVKGEQVLVTIVGNMVNPVPGEFVELDGNWGIHAKFGNQFQVKTSTTLVPATQSGIQKYLGSGLIKGIGPVMAERIVNHFGIKSLDIIEKSSDRLSEVAASAKKGFNPLRQPGMNKKKSGPSWCFYNPMA